MTLLEECIEVMGNDIYILNNDEKLFVERKLFDMLPFTRWGRIDWDNFKNKKEIYNMEDFSSMDGSKKYYIIWDDPTKPIIKSKLTNILQNLDDVLAVSFDTWLLAEDESLIIEFYHEGEMTIAILSE